MMRVLKKQLILYLVNLTNKLRNLTFINRVKPLIFSLFAKMLNREFKICLVLMFSEIVFIWFYFNDIRFKSFINIFIKYQITFQLMEDFSFWNLKWNWENYKGLDLW